MLEFTFITYSSYHDKHFLQLSIARRITIINNNETLKLKVRLDELQLCFIRSGYPKYMVTGIIIDARGKREISKNYAKTPDKAPFTVVWVQNFGPATPIISF